MPMKLEVKHKFHPQPRLSANQVADYLNANSTNRRRILRDAKYPPVVLLIPYTEAKSALGSHLISASGPTLLDSKLQALRRKAENDDIGDFERRNAKLCIESIESFQSCEGKMKLGKITFMRPGFQLPKLKISGVSLSVSVDLLTEKLGRGGTVTGGAMLVFSKSGGAQQNMPERCKAISLLIYELLKSHGTSTSTCDPTMCMAIDVFQGTIYPAKGEQKQLLKTVTTSCDEVRNLWPSVTPPSNYNPTTTK